MQCSLQMTVVDAAVFQRRIHVCLELLLVIICTALLTGDVAESATGSANWRLGTNSTASDKTTITQREELSLLELLVAATVAEDSWAGVADTAYPLQSIHQLATSGGAPAPGHTSSSASWSSGGSNSTGSYRFSHTMQIKIPQPWDRINMSQIIRDNLEPDLRFWQNIPYMSTVQDIFDLAKAKEFAALPSVRQVVEIHNNTLRFPLKPPEKQHGCDDECDAQLSAFVQAMDDAVRVYNLTLPNVLFLLNTDDAPVCSHDMVQSRTCRVPVISLCKVPYIADLLGPVMKAEDAKLVHRYLPWAQKKNKAFFRGVPSCGEMPFPPRCARSWVSRLAQTNYSELLDAGLVERYDRPDQIKADPVLQDNQGPLPVLQRVPMSSISQYKWLLNLDGHVAAYRLAQLLAANSLVLKQESLQHEYYYKSLHPYHHYVPILKRSEHDLVPKLKWAMAHEQIARHIVHRANHFALTYTTYQARIVYWVYLLHGYARLVTDMAEYFEKKEEWYVAAAVGKV